MRVAMYYNNKDVRLEEMPVPKIGPDELLVKVTASGICGSDVMEWYRVKKAPLVLGHEIAGEVVKIGRDVKNYKVGDRVFVSHHVPCNKCHYCLKGYHTVCDTLRSTNFDPGGFAEYIRVPKINVDYGVYLLPDGMSFEEGTFIEPLGCVVRGQRIAKVKQGDTILVIGSGISGLLHIQLAHELGAKRVIVTDINEYRLKVAKKFGADAVVNAKDDVPMRVYNVNENRLVDVVIVCAGAISAFAQALKCADRGGTILLFAPPEPGVNLSIPGWEFWRDQIKLISTYAASSQDITTAIELISTHKVCVQEMITHRLSLAEAGLGFKLVAKANESIKVIIKPQK
ncbi:MAG: zinc-dependent dehydrogenase [bacterium]|nr:zinc-dependent dehydrogenase [bacterium]